MSPRDLRRPAEPDAISTGMVLREVLALLDASPESEADADLQLDDSEADTAISAVGPLREALGPPVGIAPPLAVPPVVDPPPEADPPPLAKATDEHSGAPEPVSIPTPSVGQSVGGPTFTGPTPPHPAPPAAGRIGHEIIWPLIGGALGIIGLIFGIARQGRPSPEVRAAVETRPVAVAVARLATVAPTLVETSRQGRLTETSVPAAAADVAATPEPAPGPSNSEETIKPTIVPARSATPGPARSARRTAARVPPPPAAPVPADPARVDGPHPIPATSDTTPTHRPPVIAITPAGWIEVPCATRATWTCVPEGSCSWGAGLSIKAGASLSVSSDKHWETFEEFGPADAHKLCPRSPNEPP